MSKRPSRNTFVIALSVAGAGGLTSAQDFDMSRYVITGGGGMHSAGGEFELAGAIGQVGAGAMGGGAFQLTGGFWFEQPAGDCNATGTVNLLDYSAAANCLTGPGGEVDPTGCRCFDLDTDGYVTLADFARLQAGFTGS